MGHTNQPQDQTTTQLQVEILDLEEHQHGAVLRLSGEVDLATAPSLITVFRDLASRQLTEVVVDASLVTFIDSAGMHALTEGEARLHSSGARIALINSPQVRRLFELVFPNPLFASRVDTMEQAHLALGWGQGTIPLLGPAMNEEVHPSANTGVYGNSLSQ